MRLFFALVLSFTESILSNAAIISEGITDIKFAGESQKADNTNWLQKNTPLNAKSIRSPSVGYFSKKSFVSSIFSQVIALSRAGGIPRYVDSLRVLRVSFINSEMIYWKAI